ncbi:MAG: molybdate ABC transporter permease subunit [Synergistaceae bacterium]|nr:molybdate ABC transporter permease subunit [Synergistaceae bacterium]
MDLYPLLNSIRVALISSFIVFLTGIAAAWYVAKLPALLRGFVDVILTLPLVLPPTVTGYFLLRLLGPKRIIGSFMLENFAVKLSMMWYSAVFASVIVAFPLMYRTARGAFESLDKNLIYSARTLGLSDTFIFWKIILPCCKNGIMAGSVLSFARSLGEYGATSMISGYTPGKTATISTTVYQLWRTGNDELAFKWVLVNIAISFAVLMIINFLERRKS